MNNTLLNLTPKQFCDITNACSDGRKYALTQPDMAAVWDNCPRVDWLLWIAEKIGCTPDERTLRLFAVWCVRETPLADGRKVCDLLTDERSKNALVVAEKYATGNATNQELAAAGDAAGNAAGNAAWAAVWAAVWAAAGVAAGDAAGNAAWAHQAAHFRTLIENPFKEANQ